MPNILLTQRCVRACPYCFAKDHMSRSMSEDILSWEDMIYLADLVEMAGDRNISLLGGEPTLHPDFIDFTLYLLERNMVVTVFTSGIMSESKLDDMASIFDGIPKEQLSFVCNLNDPELTPDSENKRVIAFLKKFGSRVIPGFNIYRTDFEIEFLFNFINRFGLSRNIRTGLAHPIPGAGNQYISAQDVKKVVDRLLSFTPLFERFRASPMLDCGFPMCAFSDGQIGALYRLTGGELRFGCSPALDIGPDMTTWSCFPLSNHHKKSVFEFDSLAEIHEFYQEKLDGIRIETGGIFEACDACSYREEEKCSGGCVAHFIPAFKEEEPVRHGEFYV